MRCSGIEGHWQFCSKRSRALTHLVDPAFSFGIHRDQREVVVQHHNPRTRHAGGRACAADDHGPPKSLGEVRCQPSDNGNFTIGEAKVRGPAVEAEHPPAAPPGYESCSKLITESERCNDLRIPQARVTIALGGPIERSDRVLALSEAGELVHVVLTEFIVEKEWRDRSKGLFGHCGGKQQCGWVHSGEESGIDLNNGSKAVKDVLTEFRGTQSDITAPDDLTELTFCYLNGHVHPEYARVARDLRPAERVRVGGAVPVHRGGPNARRFGHSSHGRC